MLTNTSMSLTQKWREELRVSFDLVKRDLTASLIPALLFCGASLTQANSDLKACLTCFAISVPYFVGYIYCFCLANQIVGVEEDRINKPNRVIPSGRLSIKGARLRWSIAMVLFPLYGLLLAPQMCLWALMWQVIIVWYNFGGLHSHWFGKNVVFISLGTIALLGPAWNVAQPMSSNAWRWILFVAVAFGVTLNLQDLRDIDGDIASGRRTLPVTLGETPARWISAALIAVLPLFTHIFVFGHFEFKWTAFLMEAILLAINFFVVARMLTRRTPEEDDKTYMIHTTWFCTILASALVVFA